MPRYGLFFPIANCTHIAACHNKAMVNAVDSNFYSNQGGTLGKIIACKNCSGKHKYLHPCKVMNSPKNRNPPLRGVKVVRAE